MDVQFVRILLPLVYRTYIIYTISLYRFLYKKNIPIIELLHFDKKMNLQKMYTPVKFLQ